VALPANIQQRCEGLPLTNTLAYYPKVEITSDTFNSIEPTGSETNRANCYKTF
jgi:hypothetical protein